MSGASRCGDRAVLGNIGRVQAALCGCAAGHRSGAVTRERTTSALREQRSRASGTVSVSEMTTGTTVSAMQRNPHPIAPKSRVPSDTAIVFAAAVAALPAAIGQVWV